MLRFVYIVLHICGIVIHKCTAFIFSVFKLQFCYLSSCLIIPTCYIFYVSNLMCMQSLVDDNQPRPVYTFKKIHMYLFSLSMFSNFITMAYIILFMYVCMYDAGSESDLARRLFIGRVTQINQPQPPYHSLSFCLPFPCSLTLSLGR